MILVWKCDTSRHSTVSFSQSVVVAETSYQNNVRSFIILRLGEGLISSNKGNSANFSGEKKYKWSIIWGVYFLRICEKTLNPISPSYLSSNTKISTLV